MNQKLDLLFKYRRCYINNSQHEKSKGGFSITEQLNKEFKKIKHGGITRDGKISRISVLFSRFFVFLAVILSDKLS